MAASITPSPIELSRTGQVRGTMRAFISRHKWIVAVELCLVALLFAAIFMGKRS